MKPLVAFLLCFTCLFALVAPGWGLSDSQVKQVIIKESLAAYPGNCPCPYNTMRNGRSCGRRSAYNRPGGYSPICYDRDVTADMIREYKQRMAKH